jgi:hypothetical protein
LAGVGEFERLSALRHAHALASFSIRLNGDRNAPAGGRTC